MLQVASKLWLKRGEKGKGERRKEQTNLYGGFKVQTWYLYFAFDVILKDYIAFPIVWLHREIYFFVVEKALEKMYTLDQYYFFLFPFV